MRVPFSPVEKLCNGCPRRLIEWGLVAAALSGGASDGLLMALPTPKVGLPSIALGARKCSSRTVVLGREVFREMGWHGGGKCVR